MTNPLISVVIPTYNHCHFLKKSLRSVLDQTYTHWEAIVVDNHSTDNTDAVLATMQDPRIRLLKIHNNGVIAASRNLGIRSASGEWIAFLDSDDCWYPEKLTTLLKAAGTEDSVDVLSNDELMVHTRSGVTTVLRYGPYQRDFYRILLVEGNRLSPSATLVRREFLDRHKLLFDESAEYATVEDYNFWLDLARLGARFKFVHTVLGEYAVNATNASGQLERHMKNGETLLRHHVFHVQQFEPSPERLWKRVLPRLRYAEVKRLASSGRPVIAMRLALMTFVATPAGSFSYARWKLKQALGGMTS